MKNRIKMKKTIAAFVFVCTLAVAFVISGTTLAWLTDKTEPVKNTFTTSDIDIDLTETTGSEYKMVPGHTIAKDPKVTVKAGSEGCWLFVKIDKSADVSFDEYMKFAIADGWTQGSGEIPENVYYRKVADLKSEQIFGVLKDDQVTVKDTVTKDMMKDAEVPGKAPTLTFTAYASQLMKNNTEEFTAIEAWGNVLGK